jgi:nucleotide-binding universal stress UspA family protein
MQSVELRRILCPVNFSGSARRIVECASTLASLYGAELRLFHVACDSGGHGGDAEQLLASLFALTRRVSERTRVSAALAYGDRSTEITQHARLTNADLIVMGTDEVSAPAQVSSTIVADVALLAPCPVLYVRPHLLTSPSDHPDGFAEILCCANSLHGANDGDDYAHMLASRDHPRVTIVSVLGIGDDRTELAESLNHVGRKKQVVRVSLTGSPGPEIVSLAERLQSDLIVMGAVDGPSDVPRLGFTTAYVIEHAGCPVLIVPPCLAAPRVDLGTFHCAGAS